MKKVSEVSQEDLHIPSLGSISWLFCSQLYWHIYAPKGSTLKMGSSKEGENSFKVV